MGTIVIAPWIVRTVLISGYLLYPFPALDVFAVDWKINAKTAMLDSAEIKTWGRAIYDASKVEMPITEWFPNWFASTLSGTEKVLILADGLALVFFVVITVNCFVKKKREEIDFLFVMAAVASSYVFWQVSAPLMRYGYSHVLLLVVLMLGYGMENLLYKKVGIKKAFYMFVICVGLIKIIPITKYALSVGEQPYYISQKEYGNYASVAYEIKGETFYYPEEGDRIGYEAFPSSPTKSEIVFRGEKIKDGFRK